MKNFLNKFKSYFVKISKEKKKKKVLLHHSLKNATWIETGTFKGDTTKFLASKFKFVHTIEASNVLANMATRKLSKIKNKEIHIGTSQELLETILKKISGDVCFWLDSHYSGGLTFNDECPLKNELKIIENNIKKFERIVVLIDDIYGYHQHPEDYPSLMFLSEWASKLDLIWTIESDIFIAKSKDLILFP